MHLNHEQQHINHIYLQSKILNWVWVVWSAEAKEIKLNYIFVVDSRLHSIPWPRALCLIYKSPAEDINACPPPVPPKFDQPTGR